MASEVVLLLFAQKEEKKKTLCLNEEVNKCHKYADIHGHVQLEAMVILSGCEPKKKGSAFSCFMV